MSFIRRNHHGLSLAPLSVYIASTPEETMTRLTTALLLHAALLARLNIPMLLAQAGADSDAPPEPPVAHKVAHVTEVHGDKLTDDYFWFREKKNPDVIKYLEAENAYTQAVMKPTQALQETLY